MRFDKFDIPEWAPSMALYSHLVNNVGGQAGLVLRHYSTLVCDWGPLEGPHHFFYLNWVENKTRRKIEGIANSGLVIDFEPLHEGMDIDNGHQILTIDRAKAVHCETVLRRWLATPLGRKYLKAEGAKTDSVTKVIYQ